MLRVTGSAARRAVMVGALLVVFASGPSLVAAAEPLAPATPVARADALFAKVDAKSPGLAVLVTQKGKVVYERYLGAADLEHGAPLTPEARFHIASISKQFTAFSILLLAKEGKVDLDADVHAYLPDLPDYGTKITLREMILHTSGIRDQWELLMMSGMHIEDLITQDQILRMAKAQKGLNFEPGTDFSYSNMAYSLLAEVVARVSGVSFRQFAHDRIFAPMGMNDTFVYDDAREPVPNRAESYRVDPKAGVRLDRLNYSNYGATSVHTTARDLTKWAQELLHPKVFPAEVIRQASTPGALKDGRPLTYGFGLMRTPFAGHAAISHGGADASFRTMVASLPDDDATIVVLSAGGADPFATTEALVEAFFGRGNSDRKAVAYDAGRAAGIVGLYSDGWGPAREFVAHDGGLFLKVGPTEIPATFLDDGTFSVIYGVYRFRPTPTGDLVAESGIGGVPRLNRRVVRDAPTAQALSALEGAYHSDELDVTWRIAAKDGALTVTSLRSDPMVFKPAEKDQFDSPQVRLSIVRDRDGKVTGFTVSGGRTRGVIFQRQ